MLHHQDLLVIARRRVNSHEDAEDVVATALLRTVEHPGLDETRVGPFLCTMVMRLAVDTHRDRARQLTAGKRVASRELEPAPLGEVFCDAAESRWLEDLLCDIPHRERQVLDARLSGLTSQQTSVHLGLSLKATDNAYARVRTRARTLLLTAARAEAAVVPGVGAFDDPALSCLQRRARGADHGVAAELVEELAGLVAVVAGVEVDGDLLG